MRRNPPSFVLPFAVLAAAAALAPAAAAEVAVNLHGARTAEGRLQVALVDAAGYAGDAAPVAARELAPTGEVTQLAFEDVAPGRYAVMAIHDENGNGRLDANLAGVPVEGYGFSRNPRVMRRPTFDEAAFELGEDGVVLDIAIR
ncbi:MULTISPECIES: DUF2141 domain-containing protein [Luteimonas]|uniref:DUF2141 domain-containing protein n=1 Tax=Luteimonas TaxID=83614 RepID=UPI0004632352|nr:MULTISPECIES: DUF2141 domain-containing protein [Luteimonas]